MNPLYETTVAELKALAEQRIAEREKELKENESIAKRMIRNGEVLAIKDIERVCSKHLAAVTRAEADIRMWQDDIDYLSACDQSKKVQLSRQEWLHYVRGLPNLEWC